MHYDAIIVGGSFAGLSAAMQLARARRNIAVIDAGKPRNRFADAAHGILGHDGKPPGGIRQEAVQQLGHYPTATLIEGTAIGVEPTPNGFTVTLADEQQLSAARLILATGLRDELPDIPGLRERWGKTVLHCPYCHGFEVADRELGVLASNPFSVHQASLLPDWGPTTFFTQGKFEPDPDQAEFLVQRGATIVRSPIVALLGNAPDLEAVRLADGTAVAIGAVFIAPKTHLASPLAQQLGCELEDGPTGPFIRVDPLQKTSIPGVFAAGDAAMPMANATLAAASGTKAGFSAHQSLVFPQAH